MKNVWMKKVLCMSLAVILMAGGLTACGDDKQYQKDDYTKLKSDKGLDISYNIKVKDPEAEDPKLNGLLIVYGKSYRDCKIVTRFSITANQSVLDQEQFEKYLLQVANSVDFSVENENALIKDNGNRILYSHNLEFPEKQTIAGSERNMDLIFDDIYPIEKTEFDDGDLIQNIS